MDDVTEGCLGVLIGGKKSSQTDDSQVSLFDFSMLNIVVFKRNKPNVVRLKTPEFNAAVRRRCSELVMMR